MRFMYGRPVSLAILEMARNILIRRKMLGWRRKVYMEMDGIQEKRGREVDHNWERERRCSRRISMGLLARKSENSLPAWIGTFILTCGY